MMTACRSAFTSMGRTSERYRVSCIRPMARRSPSSRDTRTTRFPTSSGIPGKRTNDFMSTFPQRTFEDVREALLSKREIALVDVREEDPHAQSHPLRREPAALEARTRSLCAAAEAFGADRRARRGRRSRRARGTAPPAQLGYANVALLDGGLEGWTRAGGEVFRDVNVPSKAFGEFVEAKLHTPALSAETVEALLEQRRRRGRTRRTPLRRIPHHEHSRQHQRAGAELALRALRARAESGHTASS